MSIALADNGPASNGTTSTSATANDEREDVEAKVSGDESQAEGEEEDEEDEDEDEESDDEEEDPEAIARRLGDQLWADINKAHADMAKTTATAEPAPQAPATTASSHAQTPKEAAAISTMKTVLSFAASDPLVQSTLATTFVPGLTGSVFDLLKKAVETGIVTREVAAPLSQVIVSLAKSEILFSPLPITPTPAPEQSIGKRKRREESETPQETDAPTSKRPSQDKTNSQRSLHDDLAEAVDIITRVLKLPDSPAEVPQAPSATMIKSIQPQLHQVFLFAATSSAVVTSHDPSGASNAVLREIGALIQILAVRSGIQIAANTGHTAPGVEGHVLHGDVSHSINTAVYPCPYPQTCHKVFSRLYLLRQHQKSHSTSSTTQHRPFKCPHPDCSASFARNHDLKRHVKTHGKRAFRCSGCGKTFSRRDAVDRHKRGSGKESKGKQPTVTPACADAETLEVDMDESDRQGFRFSFKETSRRPRSWDDVSQVAEEGELNHGELVRTQELVKSLFPVLQACASSPLPPSGAADVAPPVVASDQATLASVLASFLTASSAMQVDAPMQADTVQESDASVELQPEESSPELPALSDRNAGSQTNPSLDRYGLDPTQSKLLEEAIANATAAAQAQAEAEALLEEVEDSDDDETDDSEDMDIDGGADSSMNSVAA